MVSILRGGERHAGNYRHQADVAHAYQVLVKGGMPTDRIVVMMEDDIAFHPDNPVPGKVGTLPGAKRSLIVHLCRAVTNSGTELFKHVAN